MPPKFDYGIIDSTQPVAATRQEQQPAGSTNTSDVDVNENGGNNPATTDSTQPGVEEQQPATNAANVHTDSTQTAVQEQQRATNVANVHSGQPGAGPGGSSDSQYDSITPFDGPVPEHASLVPYSIVPSHPHEPAPSHYGNLHDNQGKKPEFGAGQLFHENRDRSKHQFINNPDNGRQDGYTLHPQQVLEVLVYCLVILCPCPGDMDTPVHDSAMLAVKEYCESQGCSCKNTGKFGISKGNQCTQRNNAFVKSMFEIVSVNMYMNDRGPVSGPTRRWQHPPVHLSTGKYNDGGYWGHHSHIDWLQECVGRSDQM